MQVLIYPLRGKTNKMGQAPLMIRITVGPGDKAEFSLGKTVDPKLWDVDKKRMTGKSVPADILNKYLISVENKINLIELKLEQDETHYNAEIIRNIFQGKHISKYGLLQVLDMHNVLFEQKLGQDGFSQGRYYKYLGLKKKLTYFLQQKYNRKEIFITELSLEFIEAFWHFLTTKGKEVKGKYLAALDPESAEGQITMLKKVANQGFRKQGMVISPFDDFKCPGFTKAPKEPLTKQELDDICAKKITIPRLDRVRDRVIIGCLTGMSDSDIQSCTRDMISTDINGEKWIDKDRVKTNELCLVPLWEPVLEIIEKYKDDPELLELNRVFPQISLQKANAYMRELADICGITKHLTTHVCRHTFADIYLNNGGTYENLARILGHSNTKTTRLYGRRNKTTIKGEVASVKANFLNVVHLKEEIKKAENF